MNDFFEKLPLVHSCSLERPVLQLVPQGFTFHPRLGRSKSKLLGEFNIYLQTTHAINNLASLRAISIPSKEHHQPRRYLRDYALLHHHMNKAMIRFVSRLSHVVVVELEYVVASNLLGCHTYCNSN